MDEALRLLRTGDPAILAGAAGYMLFDVAMLGVCFAAFGNDVPPAGVLLVAYIIGQLGSLIPIPGGIGGVDAGLIGTLVLYGVDATDAAVAVIAYRGLLLAIPALLGLPALAVLRRRLRDEAHDIAACAPGNRWRCSAAVSCGGRARRVERERRRQVAVGVDLLLQFGDLLLGVAMASAPAMKRRGGCSWPAIVRSAWASLAGSPACWPFWLYQNSRWAALRSA